MCASINTLIAALLIIINFTGFDVNCVAELSVVTLIRPSVSALWTASLVGGVYLTSFPVIGRLRPATVFLPRPLVVPGRGRLTERGEGGGVCLCGYATKEHVLRHVTAFYSSSHHLGKQDFCFVTAAPELTVFLRPVSVQMCE